MKRIILSLFTIFLIYIGFSTQTTFADEQRVFDDAKLLDDVEIDYLTDTLSEHSKTFDIEFFIVTTEKNDLSSEAIEDIIIQNVEPSSDALILQYDVLADDIVLYAYENVITYLSENGEKEIETQVLHFINEGEYFEAFTQFIVVALAEMEDSLENRTGTLELTDSQNESSVVQLSDEKVYDEANILSEKERDELEKLANTYSEKSKNDFITLIVDRGYSQQLLMKYIEDMYDLNGFGFNHSHSDAAIMGIDVNSRQVYIAGFYKAERLLDDYRIELVLDDIEGFLKVDDFNQAIEQYIKSSSTYMKYKEGVPPDSIFLNSFFQFILSTIIACLVIGMMIYHSSGRKTTTDRTYRDEKNTKVLDKSDSYVRTTLSKVRKPKDNSSSGGGGGGGRSSGGHSHSGGGRSF